MRCQTCEYEPVEGLVSKPQDTAGWPQQTCKNRKDAIGIGHLENLNCTEIDQPPDVYTPHTRTHPAMLPMHHFLITHTLFFTAA